MYHEQNSIASQRHRRIQGVGVEVAAFPYKPLFFLQMYYLLIILIVFIVKCCRPICSTLNLIYQVTKRNDREFF